MSLDILMVSGIWPPAVGGPASHGPDLGRFLTARGHRVRAVTTCGAAGADPAGFPVRAARSDRHLVLRQPAAAVAVAAEISRRPDAIYSTGMYGRSALPARLLRRPLVLKLASDPAYERARRSGRFEGTLEQFQETRGDAAVRVLTRIRTAVVRSADRLVIPSGYLAAIARGWGIDEDRIRVIPNPAPVVDFDEPREDLRRRLGMTGPTFVFAGRLTRQKNVPLAPAALAAVPGSSLVIIGEGPEGDAAARAVADARVGDRVTMTGALSRSAVMEWLRAADAAVLPSDWENFPHAAVEALAAGTPVIATAVGGVPEIVQPGISGLLVSPGDARALGCAMRLVAETPVVAARLREGAAAAAGRYRADRAFEQIERIVERAAASR